MHIRDISGPTVSLSLIDGESSSASVKERALKRLTQICDSVSASGEDSFLHAPCRGFPSYFFLPVRSSLFPATTELSGEKGPSIFQRVAGLFTFVNILWVVGSVLLLIGLTSIITTIIVPFVLAAQILVKVMLQVPPPLLPSAAGNSDFWCLVCYARGNRSSRPSPSGSTCCCRGS